MLSARKGSPSAHPRSRLSVSLRGHVCLKPPPFWPADPKIWFVQVEAQFACWRITSQISKFNNVVASLSPEFAAEVMDLLVCPPVENPYTALKEQLVKHTALSEQCRLQQLFTGEDLGD